MNPLRIRTFLFLPYSFGIEAINTFIVTTVIPSKTISESRLIKIGKVYICFQTKTGQKPYPLLKVAHTCMAYIREYPLGILTGTTCIVIFVERHWYIKNLEFSIALQTCTKLQLLTLLQRTLSLCVRVSKWGSVHAKRGELAVRLNK